MWLQTITENCVAPKKYIPNIVNQFLQFHF